MCSFYTNRGCTARHQLEDVLTSLVKVHAVEQVRKNGGRHARIKEGVHFKELQDVGLFWWRLNQQCLFVVAIHVRL